jgi:hypothetical protein
MVYDLDKKIDNIIKRIKKEYFDNNINDYYSEKMKWMIKEISDWHTSKFYLYLLMNNKKDLLSLIDYTNEELLTIFDMNELMQQLSIGIDQKMKKLLIENDKFKREMFGASLYQIIKDCGRYEGSEYGMIFAKMFNFSYSIPMLYASYDSKETNPRLAEFISKYLEIGGSINTYWMPYYFDNDYSLVELNEVIRTIKLNEYSKCKEKKLT